LQVTRLLGFPFPDACFPGARDSHNFFVSIFLGMEQPDSRRKRECKNRHKGHYNSHRKKDGQHCFITLLLMLHDRVWEGGEGLVADGLHNALVVVSLGDCMMVGITPLKRVLDDY